MQKIINNSNDSHNGLYDITSKVAEIVGESNVQCVMATAGIMIHFNFMYPAFRFL